MSVGYRSVALAWLRGLPSEIVSGVYERVLYGRICLALKDAVEKGCKDLFGGQTDSAIQWLEKIDSAIVELNGLCGGASDEPSSYAVWAGYWANLSPSQAQLALLARQALWKRLPTLRISIAGVGKTIGGSLKRALVCQSIQIRRPTFPKQTNGAEHLLIVHALSARYRGSFEVEVLSTRVPPSRSLGSWVRHRLDVFRGRVAAVSTTLTIGDVVKGVKLLPANADYPLAQDALEPVSTWLLRSIEQEVKADPIICKMDAALLQEIPDVKYSGFDGTFSAHIKRKVHEYMVQAGQAHPAVDFRVRKVGSLILDEKLNRLTICLWATGLSIVAAMVLRLTGHQLMREVAPAFLITWLLISAGMAVASVVKVTSRGIRAVHEACIESLVHLPHQLCTNVGDDLSMTDINQVLTKLNASINPRPLQKLLLEALLQRHS